MGADSQRRTAPRVAMATHTTHSKPMKGLQPHERAKIEQDFGPTIAGKVPDFPERMKVQLSRPDGPVDINLTRLQCGCIAVIHPSFIDSLERTELDALLGTQESAADTLATLLARAERGELVDARDVVIAREAVELEALREAAEARSRSELAEDMAREFRDTLTQKISTDLSEGRAQLQQLQNDAYAAVIALLDAAEVHNGQAIDAADQLARAGVSEPQRRGLGRTTEVITGDTVQPWWPVQDWAAGLLGAVQTRHRLLGNSRWDRAELPRVYPSGPKPDTL